MMVVVVDGREFAQKKGRPWPCPSSFTTPISGVFIFGPAQNKLLASRLLALEPPARTRVVALAEGRTLAV